MELKDNSIKHEREVHCYFNNLVCNSIAYFTERNRVQCILRKICFLYQYHLYRGNGRGGINQPKYKLSCSDPMTILCEPFKHHPANVLDKLCVNQTPHLIWPILTISYTGHVHLNIRWTHHTLHLVILKHWSFQMHFSWNLKAIYTRIRTYRMDHGCYIQVFISEW